LITPFGVLSWASRHRGFSIKSFSLIRVRPLKAGLRMATSKYYCGSYSIAGKTIGSSPNGPVRHSLKFCSMWLRAFFPEEETWLRGMMPSEGPCHRQAITRNAVAVTHVRDLPAVRAAEEREQTKAQRKEDGHRWIASKSRGAFLRKCGQREDTDQRSQGCYRARLPAPFPPIACSGANFRGQ
jgi:hypothetical protein